MSYLSNFIDENDTTLDDYGLVFVGKWKCKDGKEIDINEMPISHLRNCLYHLYGSGDRKEFIEPMELELDFKMREYSKMKIDEK